MSQVANAPVINVVRPLGSCKFLLGGIVMTSGVGVLIREHYFDPIPLLARHVTADWSELDDELRDANKQAMIEGGRIVSVFSIVDSPVEKVWLITEADRSSTKIMLPDEKW